MKTVYTLDHPFNVFYKDKTTKVNILSDFPSKYIVLFFYPYDFTTVCPTEINRMSDLYKKFEELNTVVLCVSGDSVYSHQAWTEVPREKKGIKGCQIRLVSDYERILGRYFNVLEQKASPIQEDKETPFKINKKDQSHSIVSSSNSSSINWIDSNTKRATVILDKNLNMIHFSIYKNEIGRNTDEILRIIRMNKQVEETGEMCECDKQ